jgi:hypothetical protein
LFFWKHSPDLEKVSFFFDENLSPHLDSAFSLVAVLKLV